MSSLRIDRIRWVTLGIRMVYGPANIPPEHHKKISYFRSVVPGDFKYPMYQNLLHVNLDEIIHSYTQAEDPYDRPTR